ncbi:hypothetical protein AAF134_07290 [Synechococcus lacustris Tous-12m]
MVICFITQQWHQNHWNQHQKHLLLKLLRVAALEEQQHWQVWGWSYGVTRHNRSPSELPISAASSGSKFDADSASINFAC